MGGRPENCVTFFLPKGVKRAVSRDLIKIFEFCKVLWIANNACDIVNGKTYLYLPHGFYQTSRTLMFFAGNFVRGTHPRFENSN